MTDAEKYQAMMESLGTTPDEIADSLRMAKVKGKPGSIRSCPIAQFLRLTCDETAFAGPFHYGSGKVDVHLRTPPGVGHFMRRFDAHHYPDLEAPL